MKLSKLGRTTLSLLAVLAITACGITAPHSNEGYADLDSFSMFDVDTSMNLSIGPTLLRFAAANIEDDPETQALLEGLDGVRVRVYEINGDAERVAQDMDEMSLKLREQDWELIVQVREEGERTHVLMKLDEDRVAGLTVLTSDTHEAVVVNVMGDLQPELFSEAMAALDVPAPEVEIVHQAIP